MRLGRAFSFVNVLCLITIHSLDTRAQSIVQVIPLPNTTYWNQAYGLAPGAGAARLFINSGTTTVVFNRGHIYSLDSAGTVLDSVVTGLSSSQGLAWDGTNFWYVRGSGASARIFKIATTGAILDSITPSSVMQYMGGACWDGTGLWVSNYFPNNFAKLYKYNVSTKTLVDSIPTFGIQPQGVAWDGQNLFYAMDNNDGDPEKVYQVNMTTRDTVRSWFLPEGPTSNMSPRGLVWDGRYLWMIAEPVGASSGRSLYKYDIGGSGTPVINVPVRFFDFGRVRIGNLPQVTATIQNNGTANLRIDSVRILYSNRFTTNLVTPLTISPGNSQSFTITFAPTVYGVDSAHVILYHSDPARGPQIIRNVGMGIFPTSHITVPSGHAYGLRRVGSDCLWTLTIQNLGALPFNVDAISFGGPTFRISPGTLPLTIDSVSSRDVRVWFHPTVATSYADSMRIHSNAANAPNVSVYLTGSGDATPVPLGGIMWEGAVPDNPYTVADDFQTKSIKEIGDVNADGVNDVIVASGNYYVMCFNGSSSVVGDILWTFNTGINNNNSGSVDWEDALQVRSDVSGDGVPDVVFGCGGGNEFVYTVSGRTGQLMWGYGDSINFAQGDIMGVRVERDYNGDGVKDVLVSASGVSSFGGRHSAICLNGLNGEVIFTRPLSYNFTYDVVASRLGGAISAANDGGPYAIVGFDTTGALAWSYAISGSLNAAWSLREIPDINSDGIPDILGLYGFSGGLFAITGDAGIPIWTTSLGASNNGKIILLDDLNSNGYPDFTLSAPQALSRLDILNGNALWTVPLGSSYIRGVDYLSDVNGDGRRDIAIATQQPAKVLVVNGVNGNVLFEYLFGTSISQRGDRVATLASIDGNASTEFVGGNREGRVICFSGGPNSGLGVDPENQELPAEFALSQNFPNPFNPTTTIQVSLPVQGDVTLEVYDVLGREVRSFEIANASAGVHSVVWNGTNQRGVPVTSGVYFYQARVGDKVAVRRMLLLK